MKMDIRLPLGMMFVILGLLLTVYGLATAGQMELYRRSMQINVNLWWGITMSVFGAIFLYFGWRRGR